MVVLEKQVITTIDCPVCGASPTTCDVCGKKFKDGDNIRCLPWGYEYDDKCEANPNHDNHICDTKSCKAKFVDECAMDESIIKTRRMRF